MEKGNIVAMKKSLLRMGILEGARGVVRDVDQWGNVAVKFDEPFSISTGKTLGQGFVFDRQGEYPPEEYLNVTSQGTTEIRSLP